MVNARLRSARADDAPGWIGLWARDSALMLASQLFATVATTALAIIVARTLGPEEFGIFSAVFALSFAMLAITELGVATWLLRELSDRQVHGGVTGGLDSQSMVAGAITLVSIIGGILASGTLLVATALGATSRLTAVLIGLLLYAMLVGASGAVEATFRARRQLNAVVAIIGLEKTALVTFVVVVLQLRLGLVGIAVAFVAAGAIRFATNLIVAGTRGHVRWMKPRVGVARRVARSSLPFALNSGLTSVVVRLDPGVLALVSVAAAGYFALGDRILGALFVVPSIAAATLYPHLARTSSVRASVRRVSALLALVGLATAVAGAVLAPAIVPALFGADFKSAVGVVQIMMCALPFAFASGPLVAGLYSLGLEQRVLPYTALAVAVGTACILAGQIWVGVEGAASGYVMRQVVFLVVLLVLLRVMAPRPGGGHTVGTTLSVQRS